MVLLSYTLLSLLFAIKDRQSADVVSRLEARYRSAKTLTAAFLERYSENGQTVRAEAGTAYFRKPGKMRWEYERPEKDLFLVDGKTAWFYVPKDHTVTRIPAKRSTDFRTPLALLAGEMKVSRVCSRVSLADTVKAQVDGNVMLRCVVRGEQESRPEGAAQESDEVFFEVAPGNADLSRIVVRDPGSVEVEFQFRNWQFDAPLPDEMFRFAPPAGVAIVNGELQGDN